MVNLQLYHHETGLCLCIQWYPLSTISRTCDLLVRAQLKWKHHKDKSQLIILALKDLPIGKRTARGSEKEISYAKGSWKCDRQSRECNLIINDEYLEDSWGNPFHAKHSIKAKYCNTCSRIISKRIISKHICVL